jgi:hypothetical protein
MISVSIEVFSSRKYDPTRHTLRPRATWAKKCPLNKILEMMKLREK